MPLCIYIFSTAYLDIFYSFMCSSIFNVHSPALSGGSRRGTNSAMAPIQFGNRLWLTLQRKELTYHTEKILNWSPLIESLYPPHDVVTQESFWIRDVPSLVLYHCIFLPNPRPSSVSVSGYVYVFNVSVSVSVSLSVYMSWSVYVYVCVSVSGTVSISIFLPSFSYPS